jgi:hypothetical protein
MGETAHLAAPKHWLRLEVILAILALLGNEATSN